LQENLVPSETIGQEGELARVRSAAYGLIATALRYPDNALLSTLTDDARWGGWPEVIRRVDAESAAHLDAFRNALLELTPGQSDGPPDGLTELQDVHVHLFGHAVRGTCPAYELEYGRGEIMQQAPELADITGFYSAFGMELAGEANERPDHVSVECEFMSVLAAKEAYVIEEGKSGDAGEVLRHAQRSFVADHLGQWLPALGQRMAEAAGPGFYGAIGRFAGSFIASECRRMEITCGPEYLELRPEESSPEDPLTCGVEESCPSGPASSPPIQLEIDPAIGQQE
jgi:DMSO reductase family type II enzyme chaperone